MLIPWEQILPPLVSGSCALALTALLAVPAQLPRRAAGLPAAAVLAAAGAGLLVVFGWHVPLQATDDLLPLLAFAAALLAGVIGLARGQWTALDAAALAAVLAGAGCQLIAERLVAPPGSPAGIALGLAALTGLVAGAAELGMAVLSPLLTRLVIGLVLGGAAGTILASGVIKYGLGAGCLAAAGAAPVLLAFWRSPSIGVAGAVVPALAWCFLLTALKAPDLPHAPLIVLLPPACALGAALASGNLLRLKALRHRPGLGAGLVLGAALLLTLAALAWILLEGQPMHEEYEG